MNLTDYSIHFQPDKHRFELVIDGHRSILEFFKPDSQTLALTHTEVDPVLEGKGVGSYLVKSVLEFVDEHKWQIVPLCPFVVSYIKHHPDWNRLVSSDYEAADF